MFPEISNKQLEQNGFNREDFSIFCQLQSIHEEAPFLNDEAEPLDASLNSIYSIQPSQKEIQLEQLDEPHKKPPELHLFYKLSEDVHDPDISQEPQNSNKNRIRIQNDTKNIPKNFGKGIISFIQKNEKKIRPVIVKNGLVFSKFMKTIKTYKNTISTICKLKQLWTDEVIGKSMRMISNQFFRKYSLSYIFNSRINNHTIHIKYRQALWEALKHPNEFNHIKNY